VHQLFIPVFTPDPCGFLHILNRGKGAALPDVLILVIFIWSISKETRQLTHTPTLTSTAQDMLDP